MLLRAVFVVLVLTNLIFFGLSQNLDNGREPERIQQQITPERIRVVPLGDREALNLPEQACRLISGYRASATLQLIARLQSLGFQAVLQEDQVQEQLWVYIPGQTSRENAARRIQFLREKGMTDIEVLSNKHNQWDISLGYFTNDTAAQEFLTSLRQRGIYDAKVRTLDTVIRSMKVEGPAALLDQYLIDLRGDFPSADWTLCP